MDKENVKPSWTQFDNPLDLIWESKKEVDEELAVKEQRKAAREDAEAVKRREQEESLGRMLAEKVDTEEKDAAIAMDIQSKEKASFEAAKKKAEKERAAQLKKDEEAAKKVAAAEAAEAAKRAKQVRQSSLKDLEIAKQLQKQEDKHTEAWLAEQKWIAPVVHCEQKGECVRFWVKLPGMSHADVTIKHDETGNASIGIVAAPLNRKLVEKDFTVDVKLNAVQALSIAPSDVEVEFDEKDDILNIVCTNMKIGPTRRSSVTDKLKSFFRLNNKASKPRVVIDRIDGDTSGCKNMVLV